MTLNNHREKTIDLLLSRRSSKTRYMVEPAPTGDDLELILQAGMRVPDHGKLAPWRFVVVEKGSQARLGEIMAQCYREECPEGNEASARAMEEFARQAPGLVVAASHINRDAPIPELEQTLSAGAACQNMLIAAHSLGYVACWLTGWAAESPGVQAALGLEDSDRIVGFLFLGTPGETLKERPRPAFDTIVSYWRK